MVYPSLFPRFRPREEDQRWCEATDRGGCAVNAVGGQAEALPCAAPWARVSKALAAVVAALARHLNGRQPARHFHLDSKSVATIVKRAVVDGLARPRSQPKRAGRAPWGAGCTRRCARGWSRSRALCACCAGISTLCGLDQAAPVERHLGTFKGLSSIRQLHCSLPGASS